MVLYIFWLLKTSTPSQSKIFFVIVASSVYLPFRCQTSSKSEIFYVIVTCSLYLLFNTSTPSQSEIFLETYSVPFSLYFYVCIRISRRPLKRKNTKVAPIRRNISLWEGVLVLKSKYTEQGPRSNNKKNISLWEWCYSLKANIHKNLQ